MSLIKQIKLETPESTTAYDIGAVATNVSLQNPITVEETQYTNVESALNAINNKAGGGTANTKIIAEDFDTDTSYAVEDYVIYEGDLYICSNPHPAGAWVAADFTATTVEAELKKKVNTSNIGAAASKAVDSSISDASTSTNLPTSQAVASFVEGKGYVTTDTNTTYNLSVGTGDDASKIVLTPSSGTADKITVPYATSAGSAPASDVYSWAKASTKPSYTASEVGAVATTAVGSANGVAELDSTGKVPSSQLPSYVDDVLEYDSTSLFPATGETGKIYIAKDTNKTYRWSGTTYVEISESLALGETSSTAYAGNKGKANADAITAIKDGINIDSFSDVETALEGKANVEIIYTYGDTWNDKSWGTLAPNDGYNIWSDGDNIYYSNNTVHYVLNKSTNIWETKTWTGLTSFTGSDVWTDGDNIYYSSSSKQYVLDKSTSTWSTKTWLGKTSFSGSAIWTDGTNIYCSMEMSTIQYVLDKATSTWSNAPWYGDYPINGAKIWTDGTDIYMSSGSNQYVLNKADSTWSSKTWTGLTSFDGNYIWTDGTNIYMSKSSNQYVLNKDTSTWTQKTWTGLTSFSGNDTWTYNDNIYYAGTKELSKTASGNKIIENSIKVKSNGDLQGAAEIYDNAGNALSDKYDATSYVNRFERYTISSSNWSNSPNASGYYTNTITTSAYNSYVGFEVSCTGSADGTPATSAQEAAYALVDDVTMPDGTGATSLTLYAKTKPTTTFYIKVKGVYMAKNAASSTKALDITTGCELTVKQIFNNNTTNTVAFDGSTEHKIEFLCIAEQIITTEWSSTVDAKGYYTNTFAIPNTKRFDITYSRPRVSLIGTGNHGAPSFNSTPSAGSIAAYNLVDYFDMTDNGTNNILTAYAKTKPTTLFNICIEGISVT